MAILTGPEAASILDYASEEEMPAKVISILVPAVDNYINGATGKDWGTPSDTYTAVDPLAKMVAGVLLRRWFDDPGMVGQVNDIGILGMIGQLEAKALLEQQA